MNIALIAPQPGDTTSLYRAWGPYGALARSCPEIKLHARALDDCFSWEKFSDIDVVVMQRPFGDSRNVSAINALKDFGAKVIVDYDDDIFNLNSENKNHLKFQNSSAHNNHWAILNTADRVTVSTSVIKHSFIGKNIFRDKILVIENGIDLNAWGEFEDFGATCKNKVIWRGLDSHSEDLREVKSEFMNLYKDGFTFEFLGYNPYFITDNIPNPCWGFYKEPIHAYQKRLREFAGCIGVVPLRDNNFNQAKSNIAWLEFTMASIPVVASPMVEFMKPGLITSRPNQFASSVKSIINYKLGKQMVLESRDFIKRFYDVNKINEQRKQLLKGLLNA